MSYTFSLSRRSLPVRCLCLLLAVLVLWCFFMVPRAGAVATEAATVAYAGALIGTILVGAGVVFSSHGDMQAVGAAMYKSWIKSSNAIGSTISAIASWALEHGEAVAKGALRVGKDVYQAVVDAFNAAYSDGAFVPVGAVADFESFFTSNPSLSTFWVTLPFADELITWHEPRFESGGYQNYKLSFSYSVSDSDNETSFSLTSVMLHKTGTFSTGSANGTISGIATGLYYFSIDRDNDCLVLQIQIKKPDGSLELDRTRFFYGLSTYDLKYIGSEAPVAVSCVAGDLAYPSDNTLVRMPDIPSVDTATGTATFPSDAAYTKDAVSVPYPVDTEGVKVPDIPYDKVVDQSTGKTLDDADTGTDTKPGEGTGEGTETGSGVSGLIGTIIGLLKNFFDSPSDFKLDMDGFRNLAIADKFPFCIPFDMVDSVKQFAATAADYQFRIKFDTQYFSVDHTVDLTPIAVPLAFFRYIVCVWFVWVLMSRTHDLMKW